MPLAAAPKSSTAMSAATLDPGPARAAYGPDSSFRTPILTTPSEIWAWACSVVRLSTVKSAMKPTMRIVDVPRPVEPGRLRLDSETPRANGVSAGAAVRASPRGHLGHVPRV